MGIAPLPQRAMEDQLRQMQIKLDALERRMATGDARPWNLQIIDNVYSIPAYAVDAEYLRVNTMLFAWGRITFATSGSSGWTEEPDLRISLPYPVVAIQNGVWHAFMQSGIKYVDGVVGGFNGSVASYVDLTGRTVHGKTDVLSNKGMRAWDIAAGSDVQTLWTAGDTVELLVVARVPDGS